jgi:hypothetical protein
VLTGFLKRVAFLWDWRTIRNAMKTTRTGLLPSINHSAADPLSKRSQAGGRALRLWLCGAAVGASAAGVVALTGCKKAEAPPPPPRTIQMAGVTLDLPKLDTEFQDASPEIQAAVKQIKMSYRGGRFVRMVTELEELSSNPGLGPSQKKLVGDLIEQMKQVLAKIPPPPG